MTEEQIEWLKDNLSISVEGNNEADYKDVIVTLLSLVEKYQGIV